MYRTNGTHETIMDLIHVGEHFALSPSLTCPFSFAEKKKPPQSFYVKRKTSNEEIAGRFFYAKTAKKRNL